MKKINVCVLCGYGINCDHETAFAFERAGASPRRVHLNSLFDGSVRLEDFQILAFPGGFGWGDDHGAGVIQAVAMKTHMGAGLLEFVEAGKLVIGICNGFQTLVNLGLLPGLDHDYSRRLTALTHNDCGNFRDDWTTLEADEKSPCVFTRGMGRIELPIRHGEGKFVADEAILDRLEGERLIALRYALPEGGPAKGRFPENPNGSLRDIAGICDPTGRIFGLMPHPEAFNHWTNHPSWTRIWEERKRRGEPFLSGMTPGVRLFKNAVDFFA
ncbi:Phosphoribosylformylglycinamidine synthase subunit PurQ [Candidatus Desulfarcum epimagneticum]|uniref:Phosphoribosylformylglycinamidine synthase subunit PurQ n=1 Tax=uncultured Desulfobacteraceae bacterium TaxID=218296 RepID=A0A484HCC1_9BACT|nr:Phosphoribosylformylglycinamidine synthase subunit PurQ [uncultured Desulfobacteraceae bacterium]